MTHRNEPPAPHHHESSNVFSARSSFIAECERDQYRCAAYELSEYAAKVVCEYNKQSLIIWNAQRALMGGGT